MIFVLKRKKAIIAGITAVVLVFSAGFLRKVTETSETFLPTEGKTIIIDAGHGGNDNTINKKS